MKNTGKRTGVFIFIAFAVILFTFLSVFRLYRYPSLAMYPTIRKDSIILVTSFLGSKPVGGDLVAVEADKIGKGNVFILRVPDDTIGWDEKGIYIFPEHQSWKLMHVGKFEGGYKNVLRLGPDEYFLVADNYEKGADSRMFGTFSSGNLSGFLKYHFKM